MPRVKVTVTLTREYSVDPEEFVEDETEAVPPSGSELDECVEASVADDLEGFLDDADDVQIVVEQIESPNRESL